MPVVGLYGQTPTKALISRRESVPISGKSAKNVVAVTRPTPGMDCMTSALCCQSGLVRIMLSRSSLDSSRRFSSHMMVLSYLFATLALALLSDCFRP